MQSSITTIVVTYNRKALLQDCLRALLAQTRRPDRVLVIDNASTDGTCATLREQGWLDRTGVEVVRLEENTGGAGGFCEGMRRALAGDADWLWMMDDDAVPEPRALEELLSIADEPVNVYGSIAVSGQDTAWTTTVIDEPARIIDKAAEIPARAQVQSLPFLGFLIHRQLVDRIGLPDAGYFIAADDIEYCMRAERAGARIFVAGKSRIEHPRSDRYIARLPGRRLICLRLPPWKRYYDTRNRLLIARKYYGHRLVTQTIPGSFVRLFAALVYEPRKAAQLWSFMAGMADGLLGRKGCRHTKWGITQ